MEKTVRDEILYAFGKAIEIMEVKEKKDFDELEKLSEHAIEHVAVHKDTDLVMVTVLLYSLYKIARHLPDEEYKDILKELQTAKKHLEQNQLGKYNSSIKTLYDIVRRSNAKIKQYLHDVMHAARIKKAASLLQIGLSIGQAAGLMGLSNWDLQGYAGRTTAIEQHREATPAKKRVITALKIFGM
ncbi:MAG: hypothetical protein AB1668_02660 [Nanoarchaeota archaeon]